MPATAMDLYFTDTMPPELDLAVMVMAIVVERPAMAAMAAMPAAVVGNSIPTTVIKNYMASAVSATASRMTAAAFFGKT